MNKVWIILFYSQLCLGSTIPKQILEAVKLAYKEKHEKIEFVSGESKTQNGTPIVNKIDFIEKGDLDIWLMNQRVQAHAGTTDLAIVVKNKTSFFLELNNQGNIKPYSAVCMSCHSNGPRKIRPLKVLKGEKYLKTWNKKIIAYGRLKTFKSKYPYKTNVTSLPLELNDKHNQQQLRFSKCINCHSSQSKYRNPLKRQNVHTILALIKNGKSSNKSFDTKAKEKFMPADDEVLTELDIECMKIWFYQPKKYKSVDECVIKNSLLVSNKVDKKQMSSQ